MDFVCQEYNEVNRCLAFQFVIKPPNKIVIISIGDRDAIEEITVTVTKYQPVKKERESVKSPNSPR